MQVVKWPVFLLAIIVFSRLSGQIEVTLRECEAAFAKNNFRLLAEQFNISANEAMVIQARVWPLPYLSGEINVWNPDDKRLFDAGQNGQKVFAIEQLIVLGNKRRNEIELAKSNVNLARIQFEDLLRTLRYELRASFYSIWFEQLKLESLEKQVSHVDTLYRAYSVQAEAGNISLRESVRLQSLAWNLRTELQQIQRSLLDERETLALLTGFESQLIPIIAEADVETLLSRRPLVQRDELLSRARTNSPALRLSAELEKNSELNLRWQRSLNTPDLVLGGAYDQRGGAFNNQVNLTFGIPLPLWRPNRGRVRVAEAELEYSKLGRQYTEREVAVQFDKSFRAWETLSDQYAQLGSNESASLRIVYDGVIANFQKRNITLFEFTDFMESYNQSILNLNEMRKQLILAAEHINYLVNEDVF